MWIKTNAIVLSRIPYSDTSIICRVLTEALGKVSLISKGECVDIIEDASNKKHAEILPEFYQPLVEFMANKNYKKRVIFKNVKHQHLIYFK